MLVTDKKCRSLEEFSTLCAHLDNINYRFIEPTMNMYAPDIGHLYDDITCIDIRIHSRHYSFSGVVHEKVRTSALILVSSLLAHDGMNRKHVLQSITPFDPDNCMNYPPKHFIGTTDIRLGKMCVKLHIDAGENMIEEEYSIAVSTKYGYNYVWNIKPAGTYEAYNKEILIDFELLPRIDPLEMMQESKYKTFPTACELRKCWDIVEFVL